MHKNYIVSENRGNYKRLPGDIDGNHVGDCRFCEMISSEEAMILNTNDMCVMINQHPYNVGHVMVLPRRHIKDTRELTDVELKNLYALVNKIMTVIEKTYPVNGFNIGMNLGNIAGSTYEHLHIQIVPRWMGDVGFMESTADTKIMKEAPEDTVKKLKETIEKEKT